MSEDQDTRSVRTVTAKDGTEWVARWIDGSGIDRSAWPGLRVADRVVEFTGPGGRTLSGRVRHGDTTGDKALRVALRDALAEADAGAPGRGGDRPRGR